MAEDGEPGRDDAWERVTKNLLRAELMRRGMSYAGLAEALATIGIHDNEANLRNKVGRGRFSAVFFLQCLTALQIDWVRVPLLHELGNAADVYGAQAIAAGQLIERPPVRGPTKRGNR